MNCAHGSLLLVTPTMPGGCQYSCETFCDSRKTIIQSTRSSCIGNRRSSWGQKVFYDGRLSKSYEHSIKFLKEDSKAKWRCGQREEKETIELSKPEVLKAMGEFENACLHLKPRTVYSITNPQLLTRKNSKSPGSSLQSCQRGHDSQSVQRDRYRAQHTGEVMDLMSSSAFRKFRTLAKTCTETSWEPE